MENLDAVNALEIIETAINKAKKPAVAFSGGKDSTAVLDLVRRVAPDTLGVFSNTGVESGHTIAYVRSVPNVVEVKGDMTFWQCKDKYGWPKLKAADGGRHGNECCLYLKERPMDKYVKANGIDTVFTGLTSDESWARTQFLSRCGPYYLRKADQTWRCHPIHDWKPDDVWRYIKERGLKYNAAYDPPTSATRCGCLPCTAYISWKERLAKVNPSLLKMILRDKESQSFMEDYEQRSTPC